MQIQNSNWPKETVNSIKAVVFDMDGTLYTSESILHTAYLDAIKDFNNKFNLDIPAPSLNQILEHVGQPARIIFQKLFPNLSSEKQMVLNSLSLKNLCSAINKGGGEIYPGIIDALKFLKEKDLKLYIASNGRKAYVSSILKGFELEQYFEELKCIEDQGIQTKGEIIKNYIKKDKYSVEEVLMLGDRTSDIDAAREAKTWFAGVTWGHGPTKEIEDADIILNKTEEMIQLFRY